MLTRSDPSHYTEEEWEARRRAIIGLGPNSFGKSYYSQLRRQLASIRRLELAIEQSPNGVFICRRDGVVEYANSVTARLLNAPLANPVGLALKQLWQSVIEGVNWAAFLELASSGEACCSDLLVRDAIDRTSWVALSLTPIRDESGKITHLLGNVEDISLQKRTEEDLAETAKARQHALEAAQAASRAKSAFVANMSHEIRTPLNAILGMAHLIRRGGLTMEQSRQMTKLEKASDHLLGVINAVLDLSKIEAGKFSLDEKPLEIAALVANVRSLLNERVQNKGLRLDCSVESMPHGLLGDPTRLQQALLNFTGNAVKFTNQGGIEIRVLCLEDSAEAALIRFEVTDTGIGIAPEQLRRLFTAFEQADNSLTRNQSGTGLGLSINKKIAQLMGGDAGAISTVGVGSTFWFTARLAKGQAKAIRDPADEENPETALRRDFAGSQVLLVDDEPINLEIAKAILEDAGLVVQTAQNGEEAVDIADTTNFALILMDMQMPLMDGLEATRRIRKRPGKPVSPILAMTANAFAEDQARCLESGMNDFLTKPIDPDALYRSVHLWLNRQADSLASYRFCWSDGYNVGVDVLDKQHKHLLQICGDAAQCLRKVFPTSSIN